MTALSTEALTAHVDTYWGLTALGSLDTPGVVYSERRLRDNAAAFLSWRHGSSHQIAYALKACPMIAVADTLRRAGLKCEVQSAFELSLADAAGFHRDEIVFNGPRKDRAAAQDVMDSGGIVVADSVEEFARLQNGGVRRGLRLNPVEAQAGCFIQSSDRFGVGLDEAELLLRESASETIVHMHRLARCASPEQLVHAYTPLARWVEKVGSKIAAIDLGGGFDSSLRLTGHGVSMDALLDAHETLFGRFGQPLLFEPGRALVEDAAVAVTSVAAVKTGADGRRWAMTDIGTNLLVPVPLARFSVVSLDKADVETCLWGVADGTCSPAGLIARDVRLPTTLAEGDRLLVLFCGAYTYSLAEAFCDPIPPAYLLRRDNSLQTMLSAENGRLIGNLLFGVGCP